MTISIEDIQRHLDAVPKSIFREVVSKVDGRIPHDYMLVVYTMRELMGENCQTYLEIGVHNGGSMGVAMQSSFPCSFYGVDMFQAVLSIPRWRYFARDNLSRKKAEKNIAACNIHGYDFHIFEGDSRMVSTVNTVKEEVSSIDLLFIDGDHSYDGVKDDFINYSPLVSAGGYIIFDDYSPSHPEIQQFVSELDDPKFEHVGSTPNEYIIRRV